MVLIPELGLLVLSRVPCLFQSMGLGFSSDQELLLHYILQEIVHGFILGLALPLLFASEYLIVARLSFS